MRLVEQHIIKQSSIYYNELQDLLHKCKNLYNKGFFNIIRKSEKESFDVTMLPEGRGFWWNPVRISV